MAEISLTIRTREGVIYEGMVTGLTSTNKIGKFDILEEHANFITIIKDNLVIYEKEQQKEFNLDNGIMKVVENKVDILLGVKSG